MYKYGQYLPIYKDFCDDEEKMADFFLLSKSEFLTQYSYITEEEWYATYKEMEKINVHN